MNNQAKQMMLLAAVDGTIDELPTMRLVNGLKEVRCPHYENSDIEPCVYNGSRMATSAMVEIKANHVEMRPIRFSWENIGSVGRCSCGKVYYSLGGKR